NPPLPSKCLLLLGGTPYLVRTPVVVSAEQTSLWILALLRWLRTRFINVLHGAGSIGNRDGRRRRAAWRMPVPRRLALQHSLRRGFAAAYVAIVGSVKPACRRGGRRQLQVPEPRSIVMYNPHWQRHRSSWWEWGRHIVRQLIEQDRYNVIPPPPERL